MQNYIKNLTFLIKFKFSRRIGSITNFVETQLKRLPADWAASFTNRIFFKREDHRAHPHSNPYPEPAQNYLPVAAAGYCHHLVGIPPLEYANR